MLFHVDILSDNDIGAQPEGQTYDETNTDLSYNLVFAFQTVFVASENLDIVIKES